MRKTILALALLLTSTAGFAQRAQEIFDSYRGKENVQVVDMDKAAIDMSKAYVPNEAVKASMDHVDSMTLAMTSDEAQRKDLADKLETLKDAGFAQSTITTAEAKIKVMFKTEDDIVTEMVTLVDMEQATVATLAKGKLTPEDVKALSQMNQQK